MEARLWLTPSGNVSKLIGGIIARYQELLGIIIYAYCVLGNHLHLLIKAPLSNTDEFCENVDREISRRINWKHKREGKLWARRYDDRPVLSEEDLLEAFLYVSTNAVRHGLVSNATAWPGLNSVKHSLTERDRRFSFCHHSVPSGKERISTHRLKLTLLPQFAALSKDERVAKLSALLNERMEQIAKDRKAAGQGFLGLKAIFELPAGSIPLNVSRTPRTLCFTGNRKLYKQFKQSFKHRMALYADASFRYRLGDLNAVFPEHSFKPPLHRAPRFIPFKPLSPDFLKNPH